MLAHLTRAGLALLALAPAAHAAPPKLFPTDALTVPDAAQLTGKRVNLPLPDCAARPSDCNDVRLVNRFDGFDLDPRIEIVFGRDIQIGQVNRDTVRIERDGKRIGLNRLVWSPARRALYGHPEQPLEEGTTYRLVVDKALGGEGATTTFTTMTATGALQRMRQQLDDGSAFGAAGIAPIARGATIDGAFAAQSVLNIERMNDIGEKDTRNEVVVVSSVDNAGTFAFGSFEAPSWLDEDRTIPQVPTTSAPVVRGKERIGFALIVPAGPKPEGGWPVAIHGPGITRSKYDIFVAADFNARKGFATIAIDPVGHAYGPKSVLSVQLAEPKPRVNLPAHGRAKADPENDGIDSEELQAPLAPHPKATIALRDGLRQTALDNMALVRAIRRGVDVDGDGAPDLARDRIVYYAVSLGGIYGTMFMAAEPNVLVGAASVPGGPILDIARLAPGFRSRVARELKNRRPPLLNGGREGFTESTPLYGEPPVVKPAAGALAIQDVAAMTNWINRSGSPDAFAPLLRLRPAPGVPAKKVIYQFAYGDRTVPNPTSATLVRAGALQDVTSLYRNDRTPTASQDPHGYLLDPRITGRNLAQMMFSDFYTSFGERITDPDAAGNVFEVPIADFSSLERLNFDVPPAQGEPPPETAQDLPTPPVVRLKVRVTPRTLRRGRSTRLRVRVTSGGAAVRGARVAVGRVRARTGRAGRLTMRVRFRRAGRHRLTVRSGSRTARVTLRVR